MMTECSNNTNYSMHYKLLICTAVKWYSSILHTHKKHTCAYYTLYKWPKYRQIW